MRGGKSNVRKVSKWDHTTSSGVNVWQQSKINRKKKVPKQSKESQGFWEKIANLVGGDSLLPVLSRQQLHFDSEVRLRQHVRLTARTLHEQFNSYKQEVRRIGAESRRQQAQQKDDAPTCGICRKTKFADGCGHPCSYCQTKFCARCGGRVSLRSNNVRTPMHVLPHPPLTSSLYTTTTTTTATTTATVLVVVFIPASVCLFSSHLLNTHLPVAHFGRDQSVLEKEWLGTDPPTTGPVKGSSAVVDYRVMDWFTMCCIH
ncbi:Regulating synaptic membrane exocytosis protein 1 [Merluccius polli]|uniref:Regulating synaptic membrane exocytosis protein 1 n=1 Tax=Merluccius polli TaxID=89951 RepID=A0AA47MW30_MERPO|nr:Regulating synaptic membrane exocytosis protein 1 [Merluccius polli]